MLKKNLSFLFFLLLIKEKDSGGKIANHPIGTLSLYRNKVYAYKVSEQLDAQGS